MKKLTDLPTTDSGTVRKEVAMNWLQQLDDPDMDDVKDSIVPEPYEHEGSTYDEPIGTIRITGDAEFITQVAKMFKWFVDFESTNTRLAINLQRVEDRDTGELTNNYALYLHVAERGG